MSERSVTLQGGWNNCVQQSYFQQNPILWHVNRSRRRNAKTAEDLQVKHQEGKTPTAIQCRHLA